MRVAMVTSSVVVALLVVGWAAGASPRVAPECSPAKAQRGGLEGFRTDEAWSIRYCGRGRAVLRVEGKSFIVQGGRCTSRRVGIGAIGAVTDARGFWFLLEDANRSGRNEIIDGDIDLPGFEFVDGVTGTATVAKGLNTATFSVWWGAMKVTGRWTCGSRV